MAALTKPTILVRMLETVVSGGGHRHNVALGGSGRGGRGSEARKSEEGGEGGCRREV